MVCRSKKVVDVVEPAEGVEPESKRVGSAKRGGSGRLESSDGKTGARDARDGLHSAPIGGKTTSSTLGDRAGVHSANVQRTPPGGKGAAGVVQGDDIGEFLIEGTGDNAPTAADVDAYLEDLMGPRIVKELRASGATDWSSRVSGLEALQKLVAKKAAAGYAATATGAPDAVDAERASLFRGCVTVLARTLQDKVVPVYLPALVLLAEVYSTEFLAPIAHGPLPRAAVAHFAHQLVWRAGSSNTRAREESSYALLKLARCPSVGCAAISPWVLRPLSNTKSAHACIGRLELLRSIIAEYGLGAASGLELKEVLSFTLPLCEAAAQGARDAAVGIVLDVRATDTVRAEALIDDLRPSVLPMLKARLAPTAETKGLASLSVSGRRLPPIGSSMAAETGDEVVAFRGTPPGHEARARARQTASELGASSAPKPRKKAPKASAAASADDGEDDLLREASQLLSERSEFASSGALKFGSGSARHQTDDELMAEILEDTK